MSEKFSKVPIEEDTKILFEIETKLGSLDILYQKWYWDGVIAESFIFVGADVAKMTDAALEKEVRKSPMINSDSSITIKRSDSGFTFVNFNFVIVEDIEDVPSPPPTPEEAKRNRDDVAAYIGSSNQMETDRIVKKKREAGSH